MIEAERWMLGYTLAGATLAPGLLELLVRKELLAREDALILLNDALIGLAQYRQTDAAALAAAAAESLEKMKLVLAAPQSGAAN